MLALMGIRVVGPSQQKIGRHIKVVGKGDEALD